MKFKILVLYHFYFPDDVAGARHFQDFCENVSMAGGNAEVWPSNRTHGKYSKKLKLKEIWHDVMICRVWRPIVAQSGEIGRILNSLWMILAWCVRWIFYFQVRPQIVLIGTDPVFALVSAIFFRLISPQTKIIHWCFDLYPEAAVADQKIKQNGFLHCFLKWVMKHSYQACDVIIDLGPCMKERLQEYIAPASRITLTPWAFYEPELISPSDKAERTKLFGSAELGILYSGNFGLAHSAELSLKLAQKFKNDSIKIAFSIRGHRAETLKERCQKMELPVSFVDFVPEQDLNKRLEAADIHLVSLKEAWTGTVVPSKFFGAIAAGRPILFEGSKDSSIAKWIDEFKLGWVLTEETFDCVVEDLLRISKNKDELNLLKAHCLEIYQKYFSRKKVTSEWCSLLKQSLVNPWLLWV